MEQQLSQDDLSARLGNVLLAAVEEFIASAGPVGSQQLAAHRRLRVGPAMLRSLMAELESSGYLWQPHVSSGRVPTEKAFRFYVNRALAASRISFEDRAQIEYHYSQSASDADEAIRKTSRFLALLTRQAALVMTPRVAQMALARAKFAWLRPRRVMAIVVTDAGTVHSQPVSIDETVSQEQLDRMAAYLNKRLHGLPLAEARRWIEQRRNENWRDDDPPARVGLTLLGAAIDGFASAGLYVEGSARLLAQPEFDDRDSLRGVLETLEDRTTLLGLLEKTLESEGPTVLIGSELANRRLATLSLVAAPYASGARPIGSVGVMGPVRMPYERVIPLVEYTARALSRRLGS